MTWHNVKFETIKASTHISQKIHVDGVWHKMITSTTETPQLYSYHYRWVLSTRVVISLAVDIGH